jgi:hypothetical protein
MSRMLLQPQARAPCTCVNAKKDAQDADKINRTRHHESIRRRKKSMIKIKSVTLAQQCLV